MGVSSCPIAAKTNAGEVFKSENNFDKTTNELFVEPVAPKIDDTSIKQRAKD